MNKDQILEETLGFSASQQIFTKNKLEVQSDDKDLSHFLKLAEEGYLNSYVRSWKNDYLFIATQKGIDYLQSKVLAA